MRDTHQGPHSTGGRGGTLGAGWGDTRPSIANAAFGSSGAQAKLLARRNCSLESDNTPVHYARVHLSLSIGLRHTAQGLGSGTIWEAQGQGCRRGKGAEVQKQERPSKRSGGGRLSGDASVATSAPLPLLHPCPRASPIVPLPSPMGGMAEPN